jgi:EpsI family protein
MMDSSRRAFIFTCTLLLVCLAAVGLISRRSEPKVLVTRLERFPLRIAGLNGTDRGLPDGVVKELDTDFYVNRSYSVGIPLDVNLYIGYYGTSKGGRTGHNPYACLPGAGWAIIETGSVSLQSPAYPAGVKVNSLLARKGPRFEVVLHWYQTDGNRVLSNGIQQNIERFKSRILRNRNDGAFVRVSALCDEDGIEAAQEATKAFAEEVLRVLPQYWPVEG